jgi:RNA polymerase sigma-B factor
LQAKLSSDWRAYSRLDTQTAHLLYAGFQERGLEAELLRRYGLLATRLAQRFAGRGEAMEDLCQVALLALVRALRSYDPWRGTAFATYAVPTILGELRRHFRDRAWLVRPPRRIQEAYVVVHEATESLRAQLGRTPTVQEVAHQVGLPIDDVIEGQRASGARRAVALDGIPTHHSDRLARAAARGPAGQCVAPEDGCVLVQLVRCLPEIERSVIVLSVLWDLPQSRIAVLLGTSQARVSRARRRGLDHLRLLHHDECPAA